MSMKFCPRCKKILIPEKKEKEFFISCRCGFSEKVEKGTEIPEKFSLNERGKGFVKGENEFAIYENVCKKCGYNKAQIIDMGVFYGDEDNLILLKCGRCNFSERIGKKVS